jgi:NAD(P)-dependent dehydrogenase (short-subunit alcohol dehydrogenase family)
MQLQDRVAVVVGGAGAIGTSVCRTFAREGARVVVIDVDGAKAQALADTILAEGGYAEAIERDALLETGVDELLASIVSRHGRLDIFSWLVGWIVLRPAVEVPIEEFRRTLDINMSLQFLWAQAAARIMLPRKQGSIILIGSILGFGGTPRRVAYNASRGAVIQLTRALAVEWAADGVRVNSVAPGWVLTEAFKKLGFPIDEYRKRVPMKRLGQPDDVAGPILFLASDASSWVTGVTIPVDGGITAYVGPGDPAEA